MTYNEFVNDCAKMWSQQKEQRFGQLLMNSLFEYDPDLHNNVPKEIDPFYINSNVESFLPWLYENWRD